MRWGIAILAIGLGYLLFKQLAWIHITEPFSEHWRRLLESPDEQAMPPRGYRRIE